MAPAGGIRAPASVLCLGVTLGRVRVLFMTSVWGGQEYVPVFWVRGLALETDNQLVTPVFFDKEMALGYYGQLGKAEAPDLECFDLSALIKKIRKGGSSEFRKVSFYPSKNSVEYANSFVVSAAGGGPES